MKQILKMITAAMLLTVVALPAAAEETGISGTVRAGNVTGKPGETVCVPVSMENNPGFTNFGIALDYDREQLELVGLRFAEAEQKRGCLAEANIVWNPRQNANGAQGDLFREDVSYGYVVCAKDETETEDGVLFTAEFRLKESFSSEAEVTPVVNYIRTLGSDGKTFETLRILCESGTVSHTAGTTAKAGDVNEDGYITADDAASAFAASKDSSKLTQNQISAADVNQDGYITADDAAQIFAMSKSGQ